MSTNRQRYMPALVIVLLGIVAVAGGIIIAASKRQAAILGSPSAPPNDTEIATGSTYTSNNVIGEFPLNESMLAPAGISTAYNYESQRVRSFGGILRCYRLSSDQAQSDGWITIALPQIVMRVVPDEDISSEFIYTSSDVFLVECWNRSSEKYLVDIHANPLHFSKIGPALTRDGEIVTGVYYEDGNSIYYITILGGTEIQKVEGADRASFNIYSLPRFTDCDSSDAKRQYKGGLPCDTAPTASGQW